MAETVHDAVKALGANRLWLQFPQTDLDGVMRDHILNELTDAKAWPLDPNDVERNLQRAGAALDRCLVHRREWQELASIGLRYALDYEQFDKMSALQLQLDEAQWNDTARQLSIREEQAIESDFVNATDPLAPGFARIAQANAARLAASATSELERRKLLQERLSAEAQYRARLELLHTEPGGLLNFVERADRVSALLELDIRDATQSLTVAFQGVEEVFDVHDLRLADLTKEARPLDAMIIACRALMRRIEAEWQEEVESEIMISLRDQTWAEPRRPPKLPPINNAGVVPGEPQITWKKVCGEVTAAGGVTKRNLSVMLYDSTKFKEGAQGPQLSGRIVAVGLSFAVKDLTARKDSRLFSADAEIYPPRGRVNVGGHAFIQNIAMYQPGLPVAWTSDQPIKNVRANGQWRIDLSEIRSSYNEKLAWSDVADLFLHLVVRGKPASGRRR